MVDVVYDFLKEMSILIERYRCDGIIETGTLVGTSAAFIAQTFPFLPLITIEISKENYEAAQYVLKKYENVTLILGDAHVILPTLQDQFKMPFYYLDSHFHYDFTLHEMVSHSNITREIDLINKGVVCLCLKFLTADQYSQVIQILKNRNDLQIIKLVEGERIYFLKTS